MAEVREKDACELLDADHLAVKHRFVEYARLAYAPPPAKGARRDDRAAIAKTICDELTVHAQIEELFPKARSAPDLDLLALGDQLRPARWSS